MNKSIISMRFAAFTRLAAVVTDDRYSSVTPVFFTFFRLPFGYQYLPHPSVLHSTVE